MSFTFGANWLAYSRLLDASRVNAATQSVKDLLGVSDLNGLTAVDIGAGSGLFTIAMMRLGASSVLALDRDPACVTAIAANVRRFVDPAVVCRVEVRQADVLDPSTLPRSRFDVVYAWGSLHHTGAMWPAIENAASLSADRGLFAVALYNRTFFTRGWLAVKQLYNGAPAFVRIAMVAGLCGVRAGGRLAAGKPITRAERGMSVWYDAVDWLGGLPYEAASPAEVEQRITSLRFEPLRSRLTRRHGCNEFVFRRITDAPAVDGPQ